MDLITGMSNGIITVNDSWIEAKPRTKVTGVQTRVLAAEELIASKMFVLFRERYDGADIAHIIHGTRGRLDWDRLLHLAGDHWELLFYAMLMFKYAYPSKTDFHSQRDLGEHAGADQACDRAPRPKAEFRGSLARRAHVRDRRAGVGNEGHAGTIQKTSRDRDREPVC